jgi:hypothetical protein
MEDDPRAQGRRLVRGCERSRLEEQLWIRAYDEIWRWIPRARRPPPRAEACVELRGSLSLPLAQGA